DPHPSPPSRWGQVAEDESIALDDLSRLAGDRLGEDRARGDEGVELAVLAAGVDARRELSEQPLVVAAPAEGGVERARIDADERRLEARIHELVRQRGRVLPPEREEAALAGRGETSLTVGADILQEQIAKGNRLDPEERGGRERFRHPRLVDLVDAARRDQHLDQRDPERFGLPRKQLAANAVHADPLVALGHGRDQRLRLEQPAAKRPEDERRVLAAAPGKRKGRRRPLSKRRGFTEVRRTSGPRVDRLSAHKNLRVCGGGGPAARPPEPPFLRGLRSFRRRTVDLTRPRAGHRSCGTAP